LHIGALIRQIGLACAVVPRFPGITSALGCVIADPKHDMVQTVNLALEGIDPAALDRRLRKGSEKTSAVIAATGIPVERIDVQHELDMHYFGQTHTIAVPLGVTRPGAAPALSEGSLRAAFETAYDASFGRLLRGLPIAIASLRVSAIGHRPAFDASLFAPDPAAVLDRAARGSRQVYFSGNWRDTGIWSRLDLPAGAEIEGPAILEQSDATTVIEPGMIGRTDPLGNMIVTAVA
jgi:N-methylhydantoinase A